MIQEVEQVTPVDPKKERGRPPIATRFDSRFGRTITMLGKTPEEGWVETYCKKDGEGKCRCEIKRKGMHTPINADYLNCYKLLKKAGRENRERKRLFGML